MLPSSLETKRLLFRRPIRSDLPIYTSYCLSGRTEYVGGPFSEVQAFEKLAAMIGHWELRGFGRFVFLERATKRPLGHFGALQLSTSEPPEITWTIWDEQDEGKGFATEAGVAFKNYAKQQLGLSTLIAHVHCDNSASRGVAERLGGELDARTVPTILVAKLSVVSVSTYGLTDRTCGGVTKNLDFAGFGTTNRMTGPSPKRP